MATTTKYIGGGATATIIGLIVWFVLSNHFAVEYEGDKVCNGTYQDICEWKFNVTLNSSVYGTYYIVNKNNVELQFYPEVKDVWYCKKDGRFSSKERDNREVYPCGIGYKEFDWKAVSGNISYAEKFTCEWISMYSGL